MPTHRPAAIAALTVFCFTLLPVAALAQDVQDAPPAGMLVVEQKTDVGAYGKWTIIRPNHESFDRTDATLDVPGLAPGHYTFLADPPHGTTAHVDVFLGDDVIASADTPQVSFDLIDKMLLKLVITYTLTVQGKVGVNSNPSGVPFDLRDPNDVIRSGITPAEFSPMPIGNYSVTYKPKGCSQPPVQSALLQHEGRADFKVEIKCDSFEAVEEENKATTVTAEIHGQESVNFTDVSLDQWYAPYVATVAKRGIMSGYTDARGNFTGKFGPGDTVTIAQLAKIAHVLVKKDEKMVTSPPLNHQAAPGEWYTQYIASAEDLGWLVFVDGTVEPSRPATRAEVIVTLLHVLDIPMRWPSGTVFTDVRRSTRYAGAVETAAAEEIVSGTKDAAGNPTGEFHPDDPITRAEMAKILIAIHEKYQKRETDE